MRIGITGSHGVGKSTLVEKLSRHYDLPIIEEQARWCADEWGLEMNDKASMLTQVTMFMRQLAQEYSCASFVTDRTFLDYIAYANYLAHDGEDRLETMARKTMTMAITTLLAMSPYDYVIYMPITFPVVSDDLRPDDVGYQKYIDEQIFTLLPLFRNTKTKLLTAYDKELESVVAQIDFFRR